MKELRLCISKLLSGVGCAKLVFRKGYHSHKYLTIEGLHLLAGSAKKSRAFSFALHRQTKYPGQRSLSLNKPEPLEEIRQKSRTEGKSIKSISKSK